MIFTGVFLPGSHHPRFALEESRRRYSFPSQPHPPPRAGKRSHAKPLHTGISPRILNASSTLTHESIRRCVSAKILTCLQFRPLVPVGRRDWIPSRGSGTGSGAIVQMASESP